VSGLVPPRSLGRAAVRFSGAVLIAGAACGGSDPIIIKTGSWIGELNSQTTVERDELHAVLDLRIEAGVIAGTYEASGLFATYNLVMDVPSTPAQREGRRAFSSVSIVIDDMGMVLCSGEGRLCFWPATPTGLLPDADELSGQMAGEFEAEFGSGTWTAGTVAGTWAVRPGGPEDLGKGK
jgi:hypothetical protein